MTGIQLNLRDDFDPTNFGEVGMVDFWVGKVVIELYNIDQQYASRVDAYGLQWSTCVH